MACFFSFHNRTQGLTTAPDSSLSRAQGSTTAPDSPLSRTQGSTTAPYRPLSRTQGLNHGAVPSPLPQGEGQVRGDDDG